MHQQGGVCDIEFDKLYLFILEGYLMPRACKTKKDMANNVYGL